MAQVYTVLLQSGNCAFGKTGPHMALFRPEFATHDFVFDFDYKHIHETRRDDRKWVKVSVYLFAMQIDYQNISGEQTGPHGYVVERGTFSPTSHLVKGHEHQIMFQDFHSPHGYETCLIFKQVGPFTWKSKHRTGATIFLVLRKPGSGPHEEFVRHCGLLPDVMEAPPTISDEWEFENGKFVHYLEV